jgi:DNA invertase Pin-like site-specific DNA recombinase
MLMRETKITADHLKRDAYLYIRQSSLRQVTEHNESTQRQYALRNRAIAAGWPIERICVIDCDLGKSASIAPAARDGFQQLVSEVALGKAGIVMGLEASRLARKSSEWHRLIELCGMTATLLADEDGFYDPADFNDRLVLGLKGTMSEAESHILKARMRGGQLNKARRGELEMGPPVGLVYRNDGTIGLDPDAEVQKVLLLVFDTFERTGSAMETVRYFLQQGLLFPRRLRIGPNKGDLLWAPPRHARILQVLHNPRYAGAFVYGRTRTRHMPDGSIRAVKVARADWAARAPQAAEPPSPAMNSRRFIQSPRSMISRAGSGEPIPIRAVWEPDYTGSQSRCRSRVDSAGNATKMNTASDLRTHVSRHMNIY